MAAEVKKEIQLEIAHVLFIDIVGYSKLSINEQRAVVDELTTIVRGSDQYQKAEATGRLIKIPAGDGMALVFYTSQEAPAQCAIEISGALKAHPRLQVRMGVHSGPVSGVIDVNGHANLAGAGLNTAQRVMACGDAGHILVSKHVAEDLEEYEHWRPLLHDLGACEVKHGVRVAIVNLYADEVGNPQLPTKFQALKKHSARMRWIALATALLLLGTVIAGFLIVSRRSTPSVPAKAEKSIAVLPFENLSRDPDNAYFADGIQEEILSRLSKIADLKVISRTSTQPYKSKPDNLPEIARQLGVANILEGTVQKAADQVRVNVQLINAKNDSHLWAEKYDRKLTDVFAVESEIAKAIADTLRAKLSGSEQRAIATRPTENSEAHQLYLKGTYFSNKRTGSDLHTAIAYFKDAIGKDPNYALAYAGLADAYALVSLYGGEGPQETVPQAKAAARKALELEDGLPEAHNSLGLVLALYDFDFAQSKKEFERAIELNPNYATAHHQFGNMNLTMAGEFDRAIVEANRALELDPLSLIINSDLGVNFLLARRYDEAIDQLRKTLAMDPRFYPARLALGEALQLKGQPDEAMVEYQKAAEVTDDPVVLAYLAQGYAKTGQGDKAWNLLSQLEQLATERHVGPFILAMVHLALGENEKAIDDLERAYRHRADAFIVGIKVEPLLDPLRGDLRFERLVAKVFGSAENKSLAQPIESKSIAVLPFENLSRDPENAYFADGIQEEILTRLSKIRDLKVISRTSTQRYKSAPGNLPEIAKQLGVANILEGTVQKAANQVRVNVQLIN